METIAPADAEPLGRAAARSDPAARPGMDPWRAMWILALAIGAMLLFRDLYHIRFDGDLSIGGLALWGRDFVNVYTSGALTLEGRLGILYDVEAYRAYQQQLFDSALEYHNYSYPPVTLLYTWLFALLPYPAALILWLGGTGTAFALAARPYMRGAGLPLWMALAAPACLINLWAGHYGFLLGALWLSAWHVIPRRPLLAGILIGLMIVKPHLALLAPLVLARRGAWPTIATAALTAIGLVALSVAVFGVEPWRVYLTQTAMLQAAMVDDVDSFFISLMPTVTPSIAIVGGSTMFALLAQAAAGIAATVLLLWRLPADSKQAGLATATATFLVLPYAFAYDMTVVGLAGLLLFRRAVTDRSVPVLLGAMAFSIPVTILYFNQLLLPVAPIILFLQLLVLLEIRLPRLRRA